MRTDAFQSVPWELGPFHPSLPGPLGVSAQVMGDRLSELSFRTGFARRGVEAAMTKKNWCSVRPYLDHIDPEGAGFYELAFAQALESLTRTEVPKRAQVIRLIVVELSRISTHLACLVRVAKALRSQAVYHYLLRDREVALDLFELLAGARFSLNFIQPGGVRHDITAGFVERVLEYCALLEYRVHEYNELLVFHPTVVERTRGLARVSSELAKSFGLTGPNAFASGIDSNRRRTSGELIYSELDFDRPQALRPADYSGDTHDRIVIRIHEILQSVELLRQACERIVPGDFLAASLGPKDPVPAGRAQSSVSGARGEITCHLESKGGLAPAGVAFDVPSTTSLRAAELALLGVSIDDFELALASFDVSISEHDR